jgi:hypothetical protein
MNAPAHTPRPAETAEPAAPSTSAPAGDPTDRPAAKSPQRSDVPAWYHPLGAVALVAWLALFGAGILVDSRPHRVVISPEGARALQAEGQTTAAAEAGPRPPDAPSAVVGGPATSGELAWSWLVVFTCFLPLNLAWLCLTSSTLGAIGSRANLFDDASPPPEPDKTDPILSAVLRGFFVYLFLISGLLLLNQAPFSNAGPSQYIRLAGFLSLFSFAVSYQPRLFAELLRVAAERLGGSTGKGGIGSGSVSQKTVESEQHTKVREQETTITPGPASIAAPPRPPD